VWLSAISPGLFKTDRFGRNIAHLMHDRTCDRAAAQCPPLSSHRTPRVARPDETGGQGVEPASDKADFIQGSIIDIGGATPSL
jgi:hypothetical protein